MDTFNFFVLLHTEDNDGIQSNLFGFFMRLICIICYWICDKKHWAEQLMGALKKSDSTNKQ